MRLNHRHPSSAAGMDRPPPFQAVSATLVERFVLERYEHDDGRPVLEVHVALNRAEPSFLGFSGRGASPIVWGRNVAVGLRTSVTGSWTSWSIRRDHDSGYGASHDCGWGDAATHDLGPGDDEALFELACDVAGPIDVWAYVFVDGVFVPFGATPTRVVEDNGALLETLVV